MTDTPLPGDRWRFTHHGASFDIRVTRLALHGDVVHGTLVHGDVGDPGDEIVAPATAVRSGTRVTEE